jgi:hypothetical protein
MPISPKTHTKKPGYILTIFAHSIPRGRKQHSLNNCIEQKQFKVPGLFPTIGVSARVDDGTQRKSGRTDHGQGHREWSSSIRKTRSSS